MVTTVLDKDVKKNSLACCHHPLLCVSYLYVPLLPSQPQEGPGSPKPWYYLYASHLCPPLCRNLAHPTKGNRWCTTVHGMTSVSVGRQLMVSSVAGACHVPRWRMREWKWWWCLTVDTWVIHSSLREMFKSAMIIKAWCFFKSVIAVWGSWFNTQCEDLLKYQCLTCLFRIKNLKIIRDNPLILMWMCVLVCSFLFMLYFLFWCYFYEWVAPLRTAF